MLWHPSRDPAWEMSFGDDFEGRELDPGNWFPGYRLGRVEYYTRIGYPNAHTRGWQPNPPLAHYVIADSVLNLRVDKDLPRRDTPATPTVSALTSAIYRYDEPTGEFRDEVKFAQKYGWWEIRCKMPVCGSGAYTAFWLHSVGARNQEYSPEGVPRGNPQGDSPAVEIDIFEWLGKNPRQNLFNVHFTKDGSAAFDCPCDLTRDFHTWAILWEEGKITWHLDGSPVHVYQGATPAGRMYLLVAMFQIGGWAGNIDPGLPYPMDFAVDYVRVWRKRQAGATSGDADRQRSACGSGAGSPAREGRRTASPAAASLETLCGETVRQGMCTGGVIELGTPAGPCYRKAFGWMDREHRAPMPETAIFDLASVTKAVGTTSGLALCMDRGLLDPDAPFTTYLPDYRGTLPGPVTVRALARHLSGFSNRKFYDIEGRVAERILDFSPARPAGEPYEYSCGNYILLGLIVERLLGGNLDAILQESVFRPLGMRDTRWAPIPDPDPRRVVRQGETGAFAVASDPPARHAGRPVGNAGLFSTVDDLGVFSRMMLARGTWKGRRLLSGEVVDFLGVRPDRRSPVAFGWRVDADLNPPALSGRTMSHTGWAGNSLWIDPANQRYAIVLTNRVAEHDRAIRVRIDIAELALRAAFPEA